MVSFALMLLLGAAAGRLGIVRKESLPDVIALVLKVLLPVMLFYLMYDGATREVLTSHLPMVAFAAAFYAAIIGVMAAMARLLCLEGDKSKAFQLVFVFGNTGFIGLPLLAAVFPETGVVNLALFMIVDQVVFWTYGVRLAAGSSGKVRVSPKNFFNPNIVAILLALAFVIAEVPLPGVVDETLSVLSGVASPLCMLCLGALCHFSDIGKALRSKELYFGVVVKMVALPLTAGSLLLMAPLPRDLVASAVIMMAMPTTTLVPLTVEAYGTQGDYAAVLTVATIALSVVTIPFVVFALGL